MNIKQKLHRVDEQQPPAAGLAEDEHGNKLSCESAIEIEERNRNRNADELQ